MMKVFGAFAALHAVGLATQLPPLQDEALFPRAGACAAKFSWENTALVDSILKDVGKTTDAKTAALFGWGNGTIIGKGKCKVFPGDALWPSQAVWNIFNATLGGALIKTVPLAAPCHQDWPQVYNNATCQYIEQNWSDPHLHVEDPTSPQFPIFQGRTCLPTDDPTESCTLGGLASYSVKATNVRQIQLAINFARLTNIRLVVRNTGHDFADKSIGAGALSIWTHHLDDISFMSSYSCGGYSGPAFKLGAGVVTEQIYAAAEANEVSVVGGECHTVGIAGGYIAGGGHSPLSAMVGMGADQVLSLEVVLPSGRYVTASADSNPELYWALRGGGGSTYGVVTSVVIRAYPKIPVTTMTFGFATSENVTADTFWAAMRAYFTYFDAFTQANAFAYWLVVPITPPPATGFFFQFMPFWANNRSLESTQALVAPFLADLAALGIDVQPVFAHYPTYFQAYNGSFPPLEQVGQTSGHGGSRLFPRDNFADEAKLDATLDAVRYTVEAGGVLVGYNIRAAPPASPVSARLQDNAVNPAWRNATGFFILGAPTTAPDASPQTIAANAEVLTTDWLARWRAVSPGSGTYGSEGDINEPGFQQSFYGAQFYPRLYALKKKLDPWGLFYAPQAVGSEEWYITGQLPYYPTQNGRLCRV